MPSAPRTSTGRRLRCSPAVALLAAAGVLAPASMAAADQPGADTVVGELVQAWPEQARPDHEGSDAPLSWVRTAAGESIRVATEDVADVPAGSTVAVDVAGRVDDDAAADGYAPAHEVLATDVLAAPEAAEAAPAVADLTNQVTVALVVPAGGERDDVTLDQVVSTVDGPVARFWGEETGGAVRLGVTAAHDWLSTRAGCRDPNALWAEVASRVGFVPGPGRHLLVYLSSRPAQLPGCSYALGRVGAAPASGGNLYVRDLQPSVIAHELGHNFGLGHSSGLQCDGAVDTGHCRTRGYRDYYDVMGASWAEVGALTAAQADRLGVLPATARVELTPGSTGGTFTLAPLAGTTGLRAVRLTAPDGAAYWLEYRAATGQDAWLGTADNRFRLQAGVLLHRTGAFPDTSLLLDGTPSPAAGADADLQAALPAGSAVPVAGGAFTVTVQDLTADGATVRVAVAPSVAAAPVPPLPAPAPAGGVLPGRATGAGAAGTRSAAPGPAAAALPPGSGAAAVALPSTAPATEAGPALAETAAAGPASPWLPTALGALAGIVLLGGAVLLRRRAVERARC